MTRKTLSLALLAIALGLAGLAQAAVPRLINFQGRLADASGTPLTGSYNMTVSIWSATTGGTSCFSETQAVAVNSGLFNMNLGTATSGGIASGCDFSVPYYVQIQVGSDSPMSPRIALTAAAYALRSEVADNSVKLNGLLQGAGSGQIPSNSGGVQTNLNADMVDGYHASALLPAKPIYRCGNGGSIFDGASVCTYTYGTCGASPGGAPGCPGGTTDAGQGTISCVYTCGTDSCNGSQYRRSCAAGLLGYIRTP